jgi:hypothetical protein
MTSSVPLAVAVAALCIVTSDGVDCPKDAVMNASKMAHVAAEETKRFIVFFLLL